MRSLLLLAALCTLIAAPVGAEPGRLLVQSTTSTANSGLYDHLLPLFEDATGLDVRVVAVGTGQAIRNAMNGDGDVLLVHAKAAEERFVAEGHGVARHDLMYNDFILVGPGDDPAKVGGGTDITAALTAIRAGEAIFASRGDDSGTHKKETALWAEAGGPPAADLGWYRETGAGMGATLNIAVAMGAYTLTDRATWISFGNKGAHAVLVEGDPRLFNQYGVIAVNPDRHPGVNAADAEIFVAWLLSEAGQNAIAAFRIDGQQVFTPNANPSRWSD
ncbi:MAG: substrate-binding domain-containing protein [Pseudomonadota bacterium]